MNKIKINDQAKILLSEGKILKRNITSDDFTIVEAFGHRWKLEQSNGKWVKITQLERSENGIY